MLNKSYSCIYLLLRLFDSAYARGNYARRRQIHNNGRREYGYV